MCAAIKARSKIPRRVSAMHEGGGHTRPHLLLVNGRRVVGHTAEPAPCTCIYARARKPGHTRTVREHTDTLTVCWPARGHRSANRSFASRASERVVASRRPLGIAARLRLSALCHSLRRRPTRVQRHAAYRSHSLTCSRSSSPLHLREPICAVGITSGDW